MINMVKLPVWIFLVSVVDGMFHEPSMKHFNISLSKDSLFGYSIAYLPSSKSIIVGAPRENFIGELYDIDLRSQNIQHIPTETPSPVYPIPNHHTWLGVTVQAAKNMFVSCASRFLYQKSFEDFITSEGFCNVGIHNSHASSNKYFIQEVLIPEGTVYNSFGSSLDIISSELGNKILVGSFVYANNSFDWISTYTQPYDKMDSIMLQKYQPNLAKIFNFGYSVTAGNFFSTNDYVISSTYGTAGLGMVYIFESNLARTHTIEDKTVGSMFGASLCVIHLDDASDSLLVGAPTFWEAHSVDVGAVYLYKINTNTGNKMKLVRKITGTHNGGYFGYAITNLGDIDGDKLDDVAIGAPYADGGRGAVYIYTGAGLINNKGPRQIIRAKDIRNLGFSFTTIKNDEQSGCNDLAVGAPNMNDVVLFRCITSITIVLRAKLQNSNTQNKTRFDLESCLEVTYPSKPAKIIGDVIMSIETPYGDYTPEDRTKYTVSLIQKNPHECTTFTLALSGTTMTEQQTLAYKITAQLKEDPANLAAFDSSRVALNDRSITITEGEHIISKCGDRPCTPVLYAEFTSSIPKKSYIIGSSDNEWISLAVKNEGDTAYAVCVTFKMSGVHVLRLSATCMWSEQSSETIVCKPLRPLFKGDTWNIDKIEVETKDLTSMDENLPIEYNIYNHCGNETDKTTKLINFELISDSKTIMLKGESLPELVVSNMESYDDQEITIQHAYDIMNTGAANWINVKCIIDIPNVSTKGSITIDVVSDKHTNCQVTSEASPDGITCDIGDLRRGRKTTVIVSVKINPKSLGLSETSNATVTTTLALLLKKERKLSSISTLFMVNVNKVPLWIIIAALLMGVIILSVMGFSLYQCGFLKRQHKAKILDLQASVKEQTDMGQSSSKETEQIQENY